MRERPTVYEPLVCCAQVLNPKYVVKMPGVGRGKHPASLANLQMRARKKQSEDEEQQSEDWEQQQSEDEQQQQSEGEEQQQSEGEEQPQHGASQEGWGDKEPSVIISTPNQVMQVLGDSQQPQQQPPPAAAEQSSSLSSFSGGVPRLTNAALSTQYLQHFEDTMHHFEITFRQSRQSAATAAAAASAAAAAAAATGCGVGG